MSRVDVRRFDSGTFKSHQNEELTTDIHTHVYRQVHDVEFAETTDVVVNETLPAVEEAVAQGKARYVGITGYSLGVLKEAILKAPGRIHVNIVLLSASLRRIQLE